MNLEANASRATGRDGQPGQPGYAMAALLVAMAVMAILMTAALPTWKLMAQREKEEELIFRGTQYARAIGAYQRKYANASPPTIDVLIEQHFLRKKYKDPLAVTEDGEFALLYVNNQAPGAQGTGRQGTQQGTATGTAARGSSTGLLASTTPSGNIIGVASKNPASSLRTYNEHTHYNEWQFMALVQTTGAGGQGAGGPAGRGPGDGRGGPGFGSGTGGFGPGGPGQPGARGNGPGGPQGPGGRGGPGGPGGQGQGTPPPGGPQGFPQGGGRGR